MGGYAQVASRWAPAKSVSEMARNPVIPGASEPLPVPEMETPEFVPAAQRDQGMPRSSGWEGTGGQIANIAANFLNGWMQGRDMANAKAQQQAKQKLTSAWSAYQMAMAVAQNPDLPEQQRAAAAEQLPGLKGIYVDLVRGYGGASQQGGGKGGKKGGGGEGGGKGGGGILQGIIGAFTGQKPEYFQSGMADFLASSLPDAPPAMSPQVQAQRGAAGQELEVQKLQQNLVKLRGDLEQAQASGDPNAVSQVNRQIESVSDQLATYGVNPKLGIPGQRDMQGRQLQFAGQEMDFQKQKMDRFNAAVKNLDAAGGDFNRLSDADKMQFGWNPTGDNLILSAYMGNVGTGDGKYATTRDAIMAMRHDMNAAEAMGRPLTDQQQLRQDIEAMLAMQLQDPTMAAKAGLPRPLVPGEKVPDGIIGEYMVATLRKNASPVTPQNFDDLKSAVIRDVRAVRPDLQYLFTRTGGTDTNPSWALNPNPDPGGWNLGLATWGAKSPEQIQQDMTLARQLLVETGRNYGLDDAAMQRMFGAAPAAGQQAPQQPGAALNAPAAPQGGGAIKKWKITSPSGESQERQLTDQEKSALEGGSFRGFKFEPVASPASTPQSQGASVPGAETGAKSAPSAPPTPASAKSKAQAPASQSQPKPSPAKTETRPLSELSGRGSGGMTVSPEKSIAHIASIDPGTAEKVKAEILRMFASGTPDMDQVNAALVRGQQEAIKAKQQGGNRVATARVAQ